MDLNQTSQSDLLLINPLVYHRDEKLSSEDQLTHLMSKYAPVLRKRLLVAAINAQFKRNGQSMRLLTHGQTAREMNYEADLRSFNF